MHGLKMASTASRQPSEQQPAASHHYQLACDLVYTNLARSPGRRVMTPCIFGELVGG